MQFVYIEYLHFCNAVLSPGNSRSIGNETIKRLLRLSAGFFSTFSLWLPCYDLRASEALIIKLSYIFLAKQEISEAYTNVPAKTDVI